MKYNMEYTYKKETLVKFYNMIKSCDFSSIDVERRKELDHIIQYHIYYYRSRTYGTLSMSFFTADKLIASSRSYGLINPAEMAYFYINMVDPDLKFLEIYELANMKEDIKPMCFANFHYYDSFIIQLEKEYNDYFNVFEPEALWSRNSVKFVRAREYENK